MSRLTPRHKEELTDRRRAAIRQAFTEMFAADGDVSMERLAEKLGVANGTLYNYFHDKAELVAEVMTVRRDEMFERMKREIQPAAPVPEQLLVFARIMFEDFVRYRYLRLEYLRNHPLGQNGALPTRNLELIGQILRRGVAQGVFRELETERVALHILCTLLGKFRYLLKHDVAVDIPAEVELFRELVLPALFRR